MHNLLALAEFMAHVAATAKATGLNVEKVGGAYLDVTLNDQTRRLDLTTLYQVYEKSPDQLDDMIDSYLAGLNSRSPLPLPTTPQELADSLLPTLQTTQWLAEMQAREGVSLFARPFLTGLAIVYVVDTPGTRTYVNQTMLQDLLDSGLTVEEIHVTALNKLRKRTQAYKLQTHSGLYQLMISCETREGYAAMCVLLPETMEQWARRIPGTMLIGIPNRDFIIAFSEKNLGGVDAIDRQKSKAASRRQPALYGRLLAWRNGKIREYEPLH